MRRSHANTNKSRKAFKRRAGQTHRRNEMKTVRRGGIRL